MAGLIKLRPYQECIDKAQREFMDAPDRFRATVFACTGSGKTVNFFKLIIDETLKRMEGGESFRVLIVHPRLALSEEQQKRAHQTICQHNGLTYEFACFHSGSPVEWGEQRNRARNPRVPFSSTNADFLEKHRDKCQEDLHITWSSYHSLNEIVHLDYDLIICDEAQNLLMRKDFRSNVDAFDKNTKTIFYTATPVGLKGKMVDHAEDTLFKYDDDEDPDEEFLDPDDLGMRDVSKYGEIIAEVPPTELIPLGFVVKPIVHLMEVETYGPGDEVDWADLIGKAYMGQLEMPEVNNKFNHKMLVSMPSTRMFRDVMRNRDTISKAVGRSVDVYCVSFEWLGKNGLSDTGMSRSDLIEDFGETPNPAVILHFDTLSEGIDIDGIGGVLFLRKSLPKVKALQTVGRACRPARDDVMEDGSVRKNDRLKAHAILTLADVDGKTISEKRMEEWSQFFEVGGYRHLWAYVPKERKRGGGGNGHVNGGEERLQRKIHNFWFNRLARKKVRAIRVQYNLPLGDLNDHAFQ